MSRSLFRIGCVCGYIGLASVLFSACQRQPAQEVEAPVERGVLHPIDWPQLSDPVAPDMEIERRIDLLLLKMTRRQKVGQLLMVDAAHITPNDLREFPIGAIYSGHNSAETLADLRETADRYYASALMADLEDGPFIPPMLYADLRANSGLAYGWLNLPGQLAREAIDEPAISAQIGSFQARRLREAGYAGVLIDLPYLGAQTAPHSAQYITGLQGQPGTSSFLGSNNVTALIGPFLSAEEGEQSEMDEADLRGPRAAPTLSALQAGARGLYVTDAKWQGLPLNKSPILLTDIVRGNLGFRGLVLGGSDIDLVPGPGLDVMIAAGDWQEAFKRFNDMTRTGEIEESALDAAVRRILRIKILSGLFEAGTPGRWAGPDADRLSLVMLDETVKRAAVLLKNEKRHLPLSPGDNIQIAGAEATDLLIQNLARQFVGSDGSLALVTDTAAGVRPDSIIYVMDDMMEEAKALQDLQNYKELGLPVTLLVLTDKARGRAAAFALADAVIIGLQSGSATYALAELVFVTPEGYVARDFEGRLPTAWMQNQTALYPAGHGLRYK